MVENENHNYLLRNECGNQYEICSLELCDEVPLSILFQISFTHVKKPLLLILSSFD